VLRFRSGIWIVVFVWALCVLNLVTLAVLREWMSVLRAVPVVLFVGTAAWMLFGLPVVRVEDDAVVLVNPARGIRIPWLAITDVEPGMLLTLRTTTARYRAWAAPSGGQPTSFAQARANQQLLMQSVLPEDGEVGEPERQPADESAASVAGAAAITIRRRWLQQTRSPGTQSDGTAAAADSRVEVRWHASWLIVLGVLLALAVFAIAA
jgi:hypothetical protein